MEVTKKSKLILRLQNAAFVVLFLTAMGLLAWLSTRYSFQADWTRGGRNTLAEATVKLVATLDGPVQVTAYATDNEAVRKSIEELVGRYRRLKPDLSLRFVNPEAEPELVRKEGITTDGELVVEYKGRREQLQRVAEQELTNALQRLARGGERWVVFVAGHGERNPAGQANHDLGNFGAELKRKGLTAQSVNLAKNESIPANTSVLVVAGPRTDLLPGEVKLIDDYVDKGGNLLWLGDPGELHGLQPLAEKLGVQFLPGVVVDANTQLFGIQNPSFALVADYPPNPVVGQFDSLTLFPQAAALDHEEKAGWHYQPFLQTLARSWTETSELTGEIRFDKETEERAGPLTIGLGLTRELPAAGKAADREPPAKGDDAPPPEEEEKGRTQRVVVTGDGDFISNAFLGNGANLDLGLAMVQWLSHDDQFIEIRAKTAADLALNLSPLAQGAISLGFLILLPLALVASGVLIWWRRRRR